MSERFDKTRADGEHVGDLLSAYIDNRLDKSGHTQVREHLTVCADCRADYIELRATQQLLQSLPTMPPPRAFTLTQAMAAVKPGFWQRLLEPRNSPKFAAGSVLTFTLLAFMLIGNLVTAQSAMMTPSAAMAPLPGASAGKAEDNTLPSSTNSASDSTAATAEADVAQEAPTRAALEVSTAEAVQAMGAMKPTSVAVIAGAPSISTPQAGGEAGGQGARNTTDVNSQLPVPQATTRSSTQARSPATALAIPKTNGVAPQLAATTNAVISAGTISSPTTHAFDNQNGSSSNYSDDSLYRPAIPGPSVQSSDNTNKVQAPSQHTPYQGNSGPSSLVILEASLAVLGIALAVVALVARRR